MPCLCAFLGASGWPLGNTRCRTFRRPLPLFLLGTEHPYTSSVLSTQGWGHTNGEGYCLHALCPCGFLDVSAGLLSDAITISWTRWILGLIFSVPISKIIIRNRTSMYRGSVLSSIWCWGHTMREDFYLHVLLVWPPGSVWLGHCVARDAGLEGPLQWSSRARLRFVCHLYANECIQQLWCHFSYPEESLGPGGK